MHASQLITELVETGREATDAEIRQLREHVAQAGFDPAARERVRGRGAGIVWQGRTLRGRDMLPPAEAHYVRHVLGRPDWPDGTTIDEYLQSVEETIMNESGGAFLSYYGNKVQAGFIAPSGQWQGVEGAAWILVDFRVDRGYITTAYQVTSPGYVFSQRQRSNSKWLRRPNY